MAARLFEGEEARSQRTLAVCRRLPAGSSPRAEDGPLLGARELRTVRRAPGAHSGLREQRTAAPYPDDPDEARALLAGQLARPVEFVSCAGRGQRSYPAPGVRTNAQLLGRSGRDGKQSPGNRQRDPLGRAARTPPSRRNCPARPAGGEQVAATSWAPRPPALARVAARVRPSPVPQKKKKKKLLDGRMRSSSPHRPANPA